MEGGKGGGKKKGKEEGKKGKETKSGEMGRGGMTSPGIKPRFSAWEICALNFWLRFLILFSSLGVPISENVL